MGPSGHRRRAGGPHDQTLLPRWCVAGMLLGALLAGCGSGQDEPVPVTLAELAAQQERYDGMVVLTEGVVRTFEPPRHYWIEDPGVNRVELVPPEVAAPHVGQVVRVRGRFTFRDDQGRRITVEELEVVGPTPHPGTPVTPDS